MLASHTELGWCFKVAEHTYSLAIKPAGLTAQIRPALHNACCIPLQSMPCSQPLVRNDPYAPKPHKPASLTNQHVHKDERHPVQEGAGMQDQQPKGVEHRGLNLWVVVDRGRQRVRHSKVCKCSASPLNAVAAGADSQHYMAAACRRKGVAGAAQQQAISTCCHCRRIHLC